VLGRWEDDSDSDSDTAERLKQAIADYVPLVTQWRR
jgi:hypothetical protein